MRVWENTTAMSDGSRGSDPGDWVRNVWRGVLGRIPGVVSTTAEPSDVVSSVDLQPSETEYTVAQGSDRRTITPFRGTVTVEELYDYRLPSAHESDDGNHQAESGPYWVSSGTVSFQRANTTISFLYDGPEGLSLVIVHDAFGVGDGGSATLRFSGLPADGEWVVKDDYYDDSETGTRAVSNHDRWDVSGDVHEIDWTWGTGRTDGGAFRPLGEAFRVTVRPSFGEDAALWNEYNDGGNEHWEFLSATGEQPRRHSLSLEEPLHLVSPGHPDAEP